MAPTSYSAASIAERNTARCSGGRHCAAHSITCTSVEPVGTPYSDVRVQRGAPLGLDRGEGRRRLE
jgi:hypothetical protein